MTQPVEVPVERVAWPGNAKGLRKLTIPTAAKFIRRRIHDPRFRARAGQVLRDAGFPKGVQARCEAIRQYVKSVVDYAADPLMSEMVVDPEITLCMPGAKECMPVADCDDSLCAAASLIGALGIDVRILLLEYGGGSQVHVMTAAQDEKGKWLEVDVTTDKPVGYTSWAKTRTLIDPFDPKMMELGEFTGGAFIGAGRAYAIVPAMDPAMRLVVGAGLVTVDDVVQIAAEVNGQMIATNTALTACPAVTPADLQAWQGYYAAWQSVFNVWTQQYQAVESGGPLGELSAIPFLAGVQAQMNGYAQQLPAWQTKIQAACPKTYTPPPPITKPVEIPGRNGGGGADAVKDWGDQAAQAAKAVGILFLVGVGAYALYEVVSLTGAAAKLKAAKT